MVYLITDGVSDSMKYAVSDDMQHLKQYLPWTR